MPGTNIHSRKTASDDPSKENKRVANAEELTEEPPTDSNGETSGDDSDTSDNKNMPQGWKRIQTNQGENLYGPEFHMEIRDGNPYYIAYPDGSEWKRPSANTDTKDSETPLPQDDYYSEAERLNEERLRRGREIYESMFRPTESDAERKKREKREKAVRIAAGISDMVSALANLHFTGRYAPNAYTGTPTLSDKAQHRFDRAKAERDKDKAYNDNIQMVLNNLDKDYATMKYNIGKGRADAKAKADAIEAKQRIADADRAAKERLEREKKEQAAANEEKNRQIKLKIAKIQAQNSGNKTTTANTLQISGGVKENGDDVGVYKIPKETFRANIGLVRKNLPADIQKSLKTAIGANKRELPVEALQMVVMEFLGNTKYTDNQKNAVRTILWNLEHPKPAPAPAKKKQGYTQPKRDNEKQGYTH